MNLREKGFRLEVDKKILPKFEEQVLASGLCDFIIPMRFSSYKNMKEIIYECEGYVSIEELSINKVRDIFEILEKTLITLSKAGEFLLNPEKILLTGGNVFYNLKRKDVKIAYIPVGEEGGLIKNVLELIRFLQEKGDEQTRDYLKSTRKRIEQYSYGLREILTLVGELRREMYLCGIK